MQAPFQNKVHEVLGHMEWADGTQTPIRAWRNAPSHASECGRTAKEVFGLTERLAAFSARVLPGGQVATLESLPPSEALAKVQAFVLTRTDEQGLVLIGEVGVGKTTLLLALVRSLAKRWLAERKVVRLVTVPDFLRELRAGYDPTRQVQGEGYDQLMGQYQTCDVLVFDDLGAEKLTDWVEEQFYLLLGYRYRHRLPVFASSNERKDALARRLDRQMMDRLREMSVLLEVTGPNQRDRTVQRGQPRAS